MTWLSGWNYRNEMTVNGTTFGAQTNYTLQLNVFKGSGTDTSTNVYLNGKCNDDFSDIRFASSDGLTLLDYYIEREGFISGLSAIVSIEIDTIPISPGSSNIYVYYGNPTATSKSNGNNTFLFFDDFSGSELDINKWEVLTNGVYATGGGTLGISNNPNGKVVTKNPIQLNCEINYWISESDSITAGTANRDIKLTKGITQGNICRYGRNVSTETSTIEGTAQTFTPPAYADYFGIGYSLAKHTIRHILNGNWVFIVAGAIKQIQSSFRILDEVFYLHFGASTTEWTDVAAVSVRKYVSPEPTFGITGVEETILGNVCIKSNPSGALITIDTIPQIGKTTALSGNVCNPENTVADLTAGTDNHTYEIALAGYQPVTDLFSIVSGMVTEIDIGNLVPLPANITVTTFTAIPTAPCVSESCTVDAHVEWTNSGQATGTIIPNITINTIPVTPIPSPADVVGGATIIRDFKVTGLTDGTYDICPSPND